MMVNTGVSTASKVFLNGNILTMDSSDYLATALALDDETILAVGSNNEIKSYIGPTTEVIDLNGKTMLPGFIDSHGHISAAITISAEMASVYSPPIGSITTIDECIAALKNQKPNPDGIIMGWGFDDTVIREKRHLNKSDLDKVSTEMPIYIAHISGHIGYVNSVFLNKYGITKDSPSPEGGVICKDPVSGEPTGVLEETAAMQYTFKVMYFGENLDSIAYGTMKYAEVGVTTANDGGTHITAIPALIRAAEKGALKTRVVINPLCQVTDNVADKLEQVNNLQIDTNMITVGGMKTVHDGSIQAFTAYLSKPYHTAFQGNPNFRGYSFSPREKLVEHVKKLQKEGCQVLIHGNGDATIDDILHAFQEAQNAYPRTDIRHCIIHCQTAREDQLDKIKELGVIPSFFVLHTYYWGDRHEAIFLGPERAARINPLKSALDRGITFTTHCDTPVTPQTPLMSVWSAVNRITYKGEVLGPEYRISVKEALRSYTINAAYQNFEEHIKGSLEPGKLADMVILDQNPLTVDPLTIKDIKVLETILGGRTVYKSEE